MLSALDAILAHKSAHYSAVGPVIAEPFISPLLFNNPCDILKIEKHAIFSPV